MGLRSKVGVASRASIRQVSPLFMQRFVTLFLLVFAMWTIFVVDAVFGLGLTEYGVRPREWKGLIGVVAWPFLHGNYGHIASNTVSLLLFGGIISARNRQTFWRLSVYATLMAGFGLWLVGRPATHIGASGLVFACFGYIVTRGFYDRRPLSILLAIGVILLFGGIVWGVLPTDPRVSWEGHFLGVAAGAVFATRSRGRGYR